MATRVDNRDETNWSGAWFPIFEYFTMTDMTQVELTPEQRDLLLRGLNFIRSSVKLSLGENRPSFDERTETLDEIAALEQYLREGVRPPASANVG